MKFVIPNFIIIQLVERGVANTIKLDKIIPIFAEIH